jgi:hypothetical protein
MNLTLHIERLVLDGLPVTSSNGVLLQAAVEAELGRLLASELMAPAVSSLQARVTGGEMQFRPGVSAGELGGQIGRSVFASLTSSGLAASPRPKRDSASVERVNQASVRNPDLRQTNNQRR